MKCGRGGQKKVIYAIFVQTKELYVAVKKNMDKKYNCPQCNQLMQPVKLATHSAGVSVYLNYQDRASLFICVNHTCGKCGLLMVIGEPSEKELTEEEVEVIRNYEYPTPITNKDNLK